jgi:hypothetical protein
METKIESENSITTVTSQEKLRPELKLLDDIMNFIKKRLSDEIINKGPFFAYYKRDDEALVSLSSTIIANLIVMFTDQTLSKEKLFLGSLSVLSNIMECTTNGLKAQYDYNTLPTNSELH